ncbi:F0F1 ATP synthase subunit delta [Consotaella salsifontis]|uniref:ATP synthase subunit delta n=1 Tax=Consotaella salsifontis TaxID=1365950 RepID=A0A1T4RXX7_9HYPH|nr:F0F1 ATP synthase subunit delta [Consotaella salsifontis]SKA20598.1 ATP synthase F1 subcomplex delta subunit [Consotaella salsifontis]
MSQSSSPVSGVAERYAQSLYELARDENRISAVETELDAFGRLVEESEDFRRLVESPVFSSEEQLRAVSAIAVKIGSSELTSNFLKVIAANRRLFALPSMIKAFHRLAAEGRGEAEAEVVSAEALTDVQRRDLAEAIAAYSGKSVTLRERVDPDILGGLVVRVGSRQIDTSIRTKLNSLKLALKEVG